MAATSIVLASNNRGKLKELETILTPYRLSVRPLADFSKESVEETGTTFHANALLKARYASGVANLPAIADDSGIEVDALNGAPGVYSARYAGTGATDDANNRKLLAALRDVPSQLRSARFRCVLAYVENATSEPIFAEGVWEGRILDAPKGAGGFGYDPLFLPKNSLLSAGELSVEEKNLISHRAQALRELAARLLVKS